MFRDEENAVIGGVLCGISAYLNINVSLLRILFLCLLFLSDFPITIFYIILWIGIPSK